MGDILSTTDKRELQLSELKILRELDRICKKNGLVYYLTAGTLLGAVRHGGFIPWDDDIDVAMPRRDYDRLAKIAQSELADGFFYQDEKSEESYPFFFAKIRMDAKEVYEPNLSSFNIHKGVYLDIFPLDKCPKSERGAVLFFKAIELLGCAIISKYDESFTCGYKRIVTRTCFIVLRILPTKLLRAIRRGVCRITAAFSSGERLATVSGSHGYPRESYDSEWFCDTVMLRFEDGEFPAPSKWQNLLENMYGDYRTAPGEQERRGHFRYQ